MKDRKDLLKQISTHQVEFGGVMIDDIWIHVGFLQARLNSIIEFTMIFIWLLEGDLKWVICLMRLISEIYVQCTLWDIFKVGGIVHSMGWSKKMSTFHNHRLKLECLIIDVNLLGFKFHILYMLRGEIIIDCLKETFSERLLQIFSYDIHEIMWRVLERWNNI